jgi:cell division protein FtsB
MESIEQSLLELKNKIRHSAPVLQQERAIDDIIARYKAESALVAENTSKLGKLESENAALRQENRKLRGEDLVISYILVLKALVL